MKETFSNVTMKVPDVYWESDLGLVDKVRRLVTISFTVQWTDIAAVKRLARYALQGHKLDVTLESPQESFQMETPLYSGPLEINPGIAVEFRPKITFDKV